MRIFLALLILGFLTSCASGGVNEFFDRLEFEEGQEGCIRATGQLSVGNNPLASSNINVNLIKKQGDNPPDC